MSQIRSYASAALLRGVALRSLLIGLALTPYFALGAPFNLSWNGIVQTGFDPTPPGVNNNDPFVFTFTVDNGGATAASQTWTISDFVKATISVNSGVYIGEKSTIDTGSSGGIFQTDALGNVTSVPSNWRDFFTGNPFTDSLGNNETNSGLGGYFINGFNEVWVINTPSNPGGNQIEISALSVGQNQDPANWMVSPAVPEPATLVLGAIGLLLCLSRRV